MLSTRAAAFSVDALLNEDNAGTKRQSESKPASNFCESVPKSPTSPSDPYRLGNEAVDDSPPPVRQLIQGKQNETPCEMFTENDDGWLSIKGKECKIFPFKIGHGGPGLPSVQTISKSKPRVDVLKKHENIGFNTSATMDISQVKVNVAGLQRSADSDKFKVLAIQTGNDSKRGFISLGSCQNSSAFIEPKERSSSVDETRRSSREMERLQERRSSFSHPSVLETTMMNSFVENSEHRAMYHSKLFKAFQRRSAAPKTHHLMNAEACSYGEIKGMGMIPELTRRNEAGLESLGSKLPETERTNFTGNKITGNGGLNIGNAGKQFLNFRNPRHGAESLNHSTMRNFRDVIGKKMLTGESVNLNFFPDDSNTLYGSRLVDHHMKMGDNTQDFGHHAYRETQNTKISNDSSPTPVYDTHRCIGHYQESRYDAERRRFDGGETAFRHWLAPEPIESSPLSPHSSLLQSVVPREPEQKAGEPQFRPPDRDELRRLLSLNGNGHIPVTEVFRQDEMEDTELVRLRGGVTVELLQKDLWQKFDQHCTEMIITKIGRRMFPVLRVRITGLDPSKFYLLYVDIHPVDNKRYRYVYQSSCWLVAGAADNQDQDGRGRDEPSPGPSAVSDTGTPCLGDGGSGIYLHPESPAAGAHWNAPHTIAFDKLKLTNNRRGAAGGQICLHSMQKYQPRIWIQEVCPDPPQPDLPGSSTSRHNGRSLEGVGHALPVASMQYAEAENLVKMDMDVDEERVKLHCRRRPNAITHGQALGEDWLAKVDRRLADAAVFRVTSFITVTAYQNQQVTKLKISANPFAKGFRETIKQRDDCDAHRPHERVSGSLQDRPIPPLFSYNLRSHFPSFFPHQTHLHQNQMINPLVNYPPFLLPSFPLLAHQWNVTNRGNTETASSLSSPAETPANLDGPIDHREEVSGRSKESRLPWEHNLSRQDKAMKQEMPTFLESMSSFKQDHSFDILETSLKQPDSFAHTTSSLGTLNGAFSHCHTESPVITIQKDRIDMPSDEEHISPTSLTERKIREETIPNANSQVEIDVCSIPTIPSYLEIHPCSTDSTFQSKMDVDVEKSCSGESWSRTVNLDSPGCDRMPARSEHSPSSIGLLSSEDCSQTSSSFSHEAQENYGVLPQDNQTYSFNANLTRPFVWHQLSHSDPVPQLSNVASSTSSCLENNDCSVLDLTTKK